MNPLIYSLMPPVSMGILFILGALPANNRWLPPLAMAALGEVVAFFLPLLVVWLLGRKGQSPMKLRLGGSRLRFAPFVFFSALAVSLLSFFLNYLVALFTGGALLEDTAYSAWSQYGGTPTWLLVLVIAFLPALAEELFFRVVTVKKALYGERLRREQNRYMLIVRDLPQQAAGDVGVNNHTPPG